MTVDFEVGGELYPLQDGQAVNLAENLRLKAAGLLGALGAEGALKVADGIEDVLVDRADRPVSLDGEDEAEAVFYMLNVTSLTSPPESEDRLLFDAVRVLHERLHGA